MNQIYKQYHPLLAEQYKGGSADDSLHLHSLQHIATGCKSIVRLLSQTFPLFSFDLDEKSDEGKMMLKSYVMQVFLVVLSGLGIRPTI